MSDPEDGKDDKVSLRVDRLAAAMERARAHARGETPPSEPKAPAERPVVVPTPVAPMLDAETMAELARIDPLAGLKTPSPGSERAPPEAPATPDRAGDPAPSPSPVPPVPIPDIATPPARPVGARGNAVPPLTAPPPAPQGPKPVMPPADMPPSMPLEKARPSVLPAPDANLDPERAARPRNRLVVTPAVAAEAKSVAPAPRPQGDALAPAVLALQGICVQIDGHQVLSDVSFTVRAGEVTALVGHGGAGKSTALRTGLGLIRPLRGTVTAAGQSVTGWPAYRIAQLGVGYVPQDLGLFADFTVAENMALGARAGPIPPQRLDWLLGLFPPLARVLQIPVWGLSRTACEMTALARALAEKRSLYILDMPADGVTPHTRAALSTALSDLSLQGAAIVIATRDVEAAAAFAQTAVLLEAGRVRWQGPPRTIADDPALLAALLANREGAQ